MSKTSLSQKASSQIDAELNKWFGNVRPTRWVTRERPKIDRIACPWLIRRFIDPNAVILYAPTERVFDVAKAENAVPFDIPGAPFTHDGDYCSFDSFIKKFHLGHSALDALALIVRGADTDTHELAPEAAGLHALSLGLCLNIRDDQELLAQGLVVYDALYSWADKAKSERHDWKP